MELAALIWALTWVIAARITCPIVLETDSLFALSVLESRWNPGVYEALADIGSALLALARLQTDVQWQHVHAHEGHPWNELADCLA
eukprot:14907269-Heterocapsa_arctica.AAC.1